MVTWQGRRGGFGHAPIWPRSAARHRYRAPQGEEGIEESRVQVRSRVEWAVSRLTCTKHNTVLASLLLAITLAFALGFTTLVAS